MRWLDCTLHSEKHSRLSRFDRSEAVDTGFYLTCSMKEVAQLGVELSVEERNLLSVSYKNVSS